MPIGFKKSTGRTSSPINSQTLPGPSNLNPLFLDGICVVALLAVSDFFCFDAGKEPTVIFSLVPSHDPLHYQGREIQDTQPHFGVKLTNKSLFKSAYRCYFLTRDPQHFSTIPVLRDGFSGHNISLTKGAWVCATRLRMFFFMVFSKRAFSDS